MQNVGQGNIVNDVLFVYNDFGQLTTDYQSHEDAVNPATTPKVQYTYADGSDNTIRPTALVYPNGRELNYDFGSTGEMDDAASRVASLIDDDGTTHLVDYSHLGQGSVVEQESPQPDLLYTLVSLTGSDDPDTGDIYAGLDRFGRVKDVRWRNTVSDTDLSRVEYGYNRASNRIWRKNPTDPNAHYDWLYTYDAIQRLKSGERGTLNSNGTAITDPQFAQCWSLDETGNWRKFLEDDNGDLTWNLNQTRTSSTVNEITNITETAGPSWVTPAYSKAGNMTTMPQPADPTTSFTATYDAWNRLTKLTDGTDTVQENVYDGRNFRVIQKTYTDGDLNETRQYYYTNRWQIIEERLDASSTPDRHFVWGKRYIDDLICRDRSDAGTLDERLYPLPGGNWNVTALVNTSGAVVERIEYDPYGQATWLSSTFVGQSSSLYNWETSYCSYRFNGETGLFHICYRMYHVQMGTWTSRDPLGYADGMSQYEYIMSGPIDGSDPRGLQECSVTVYAGNNYNVGKMLKDKYPEDTIPKNQFIAPVGCGIIDSDNTPKSLQEIVETKHPCNSIISYSSKKRKGTLYFSQATSVIKDTLDAAIRAARSLCKGVSPAHPNVLKKNRCEPPICTSVKVKVICDEDAQRLLSTGDYSDYDDTGEVIHGHVDPKYSNIPFGDGTRGSLCEYERTIRCLGK